MYLPCGDFYQRQLTLTGGQMKKTTQRFFIMPAVGLGLFLVLPWLVFGNAPGKTPAQPEATIIRVATTGSDTSGCGSQASPCQTLQYAVDKSIAGDEIRVATGAYTSLQGHATPAGYPNSPASGIITQVVYINKTVTIRGGYTTDFTNPPNPGANPTTLDAQNIGRPVVIAGNISPTIEGLRLTGGNASNLGGSPISIDGGGGLYVISATATISNNLVFDNRAKDGGGLFLQKCTVSLSRNTIYSNTVQYYGGGMHLQDSATSLAGNTIFSNAATNVIGSGGGLYVMRGTATLSDNTIYSNTVKSNGGGILLNTSKNAALTGNSVLSNTAQSTGGAVWMNYGDGTHMVGNTFANNKADAYGGGLYLYQGYSTLMGNTILSNTAESGGGLYVVGREITLTANTVLSNTAQMGGGVYLSYNNSTLNRNTISFNRVTLEHGEGGGIFIYYSKPKLNGNIITFNYSDWGGGVGVFNSSPVLSNTVIADNMAGERGSGISIRNDSSPRLWHSTIARNRGGDGSGVTIGYMFPDNCSVEMTNTIVVSHSVGISITGGDTVILAGTLWYNNTADWDGLGTIITGAHNFRGNPLFTADGYHITEASTAIDHGIAAGVTTDLDNEIRLGIPDLGADELGVDYLYLYLSLIRRDY
jgi:parallel beta-helix repeat protein